MTDVIVIGGGPAGMMAAATAALYGKKVVLLEKNSRCGRKLAITGKGRCNVTNDCDETAFLQNVPTNPKFLYSVIRAFGTQDTKDWFEGRGVALKTERGNRVFPQSDRAQDIVEAMVRACKESGVEIRECEARICSAKRQCLRRFMQRRTALSVPFGYCGDGRGILPCDGFDRRRLPFCRAGRTHCNRKETLAGAFGF